MYTLNLQDTESSDKEKAGEGEGEEEEGESVTVFSRADHLSLLGFHDALHQDTRTERPEHGLENSLIIGCEEDDVESINARGDEVVGIMTAGRAGGVSGEHRTQTVMNETEITTGARDMEWDHFRADFMEQLQSSSDEVRLETGDPAAVKEHLLMKAISELQAQEHVSTRSQTTGSSTAGSDDGTACTSGQMCTSSEAACVNSSCQPCGDSGPVSLLSTSTLDGIEMSALDRALEEIEEDGANRRGGHRSIECPPPPKLAWGDIGGDCGTGGSAPDLMSQLTAISKTQELGVTEGVQARKEGRWVVANEVEEVNQREDEKAKRTVYIDLRTTHHRPNNDNVPHAHLNQLRQ